MAATASPFSTKRRDIPRCLEGAALNSLKIEVALSFLVNLSTAFEMLNCDWVRASL
jgi:hypothetical protein